jgi:steroid 5-alpha reductase family enzyme
MISYIAIQLCVVWAYMTTWFFIAVRLQKNDVADIAWGGGFIVAAVTAIALQNALTPRAVLIFLLVLVWGVRLIAHIGARNIGKPEDPRYRQWRQDWGTHTAIRSFFQIFLFQGLLLLIISIPATYCIMSESRPLSLLDLVGFAAWLTGFLFETVGDRQLATFKKDPANKGRIMTSGLWKCTRHPNYFGEVLLWWGIYIIALSVPGGWMTIIGPLTITVLILWVSGIPLLENKYKGNAEFEEYKRTTSAFFPLPPER